tara:strand:+ start:792 stop:1289 length:498 start_codon:yes stop_codon:yes gene_type:complete
MKRLFIFLIIFFTTTNLNAEQIIKYIDIDLILKNSKGGKIIIEELKKIDSKNIQELKVKEIELKKLDEEIKKTTNIISETELQIKIEDLKNKVSLYKKYQKNKSNEFSKTKNEKIQAFFINISPIIENYMKDNNISMLVDKKNIFIADSNYDITTQIIEILDKQN